MSDIAQILEAIKNGELGVVAQKLTALQTELNTALTAIANLTAEVEGTSTITSGGLTTSAVGVIHSPARSVAGSGSAEYFKGTYYVSEPANAVSNPPSSPVDACFIFGNNSACYFNYNPTDQYHGVNKKYVDNSMSPLITAVGNLINRTGDSVPQGIPIISETFIFSSRVTGTGPFTPYASKWLIDGGLAYDSTNNEFTPTLTGTQPNDAAWLTEWNAQATNNTSCFWLNIEDGRYFGNITDDHHILTLAFGRFTYVAIGSNVGKTVAFDSTSELIWIDTSRTATAKLASDPNALATMQNVHDLLPSYLFPPAYGYFSATGAVGGIFSTTLAPADLNTSGTPLNINNAGSGVIQVTNPGIYEITGILYIPAATGPSSQGKLSIYLNGSPTLATEPDSGEGEYNGVVNYIGPLTGTDSITLQVLSSYG